MSMLYSDTLSMYCVSHFNTYYYTDLCKTNYSETCLNWILNKTESCINQTLNKVQMYEIFVTLTSLVSIIEVSACAKSYLCYPVFFTIWSRKPAIKEIKIEINMFSLNLNGIFVLTMFKKSYFLVNYVTGRRQITNVEVNR
jgi:hypothetical protein